MTGVGVGIGYAIFISFFLLAFIPLMTVLALKEIGLFKNLTSEARIFAFIVSFIGLILLTLLIIRTFPYVSINWLMLYTFSLSLILFILIYKRKKMNKNNN